VSDLTHALSTLPERTADDPLFEALAARAVRRGGAIRTRRRLTLAAVPALAAVGAGVVLVPRHHDDRLRPAPAATAPAHLLSRTVASTAAQPDTGRDAPYWFVESSGEQNGIDRVTKTFRHVTWDLTRQWLGHTADDVMDGQALGSPWFLPLQSGPVTWDGLRGLPTDPTALRAALTWDGEQDTLKLWRDLTDLLGRSPAPPALRAALLQVAAQLPEVTVSEGADSTGRAALLLTYAYPTSAGATSRDFVDPQTGQLLETQEFSGTAPADLESAPVGTMVARTTYRVSGPVPDSTTVLP
jgi:hypothetical protein